MPRKNQDTDITASFRRHHLKHICEIRTEQMCGRPEGGKKLLERKFNNDFLPTGGMRELP